MDLIAIIQDPLVHLQLPSITIANESTYYAKKYCIQYSVFPKAHNDRNMTMYFPEYKIIFMGNLLISRVDPLKPHGNPYGYIQLLEERLEWDVDIFIPGHGPIATMEEAKLQLGYMREIIDLVKDHLENGTELLKSKISGL